MPYKDANTSTVEDVFITVAGGVAYVAKAPKTVNVHIIDYDNLRSDFPAAFQQLSPQERAFYSDAEKNAGGLR